MRLEELSSLYDEKNESILEEKIKDKLKDEIQLLLLYDGEEVEDKSNKEVLQIISTFLKDDRRAMERISKAFLNASRNLFMEYSSCVKEDIELVDYIGNNWAVSQSDNPNKAIVESFSDDAIWTKSHTAKMLKVSRPTIDNWIENNSDDIKISKQGIWVKPFLQWCMNNQPKHFESFKSNHKS